MSPREVKRLRKALGLSQQALADLIGCQQHVVSYWETGKHKPRGANLKALRELAEKARKRTKGLSR